MNGKRVAQARRAGSAPRVVSPRNKVTIALPLSMIKTGDPMTMRVSDWISLAGLVTTVIGFAAAIRELTRISHSTAANRPADEAADAPG